MSDPAAIKTAIERTTRALRLKPSLGQSTSISKTKIINGLTCEITEGDWKLKADMPASVGGNGAGPSPGVLGRAALGSCLAIGYAMKAASMNIPIDSLEVEVEADYDDGALFGTVDTWPGYLQVRYIINIESTADAGLITSMLDDADKHSPYLDVFSRGQECVREVRIINTKAI